MSWKAYVTATFVTLLVAAVPGCDDSDPVNPEPDPDPISVAGVYYYTFTFDNSEAGEGDISCEGNGLITITQDTDSTFSGETAADGVIECSGLPIEGPSGVIDITGQIGGTEVTLDFPLIGQQLCDASGTVEGDPVTSLSGTATCLVDPADLGLSGDPVELTGDWQADRTGE